MHTNTIIGKTAHWIVEIMTHRGKTQMHIAGTKHINGKLTEVRLLRGRSRKPQEDPAGNLLLLSKGEVKGQTWAAVF